MNMRRRILLSMLCLSLASLAPTPLSACAVMMTLPTECAPAHVRAASHGSQCEQAMASGTQVDENSAQLRAKASQLPCCQLIAAPVPDASAGISKIKVASAVAALEIVTQASTTKIFERTTAQIQRELSASPPDRQPLLCTFLI